uniref:Uncharacterized protein n=1 Tax=viral metagenome TaxID=1070528 RepID=A0A2V0R9Z9_9ZZZZ
MGQNVLQNHASVSLGMQTALDFLAFTKAHLSNPNSPVRVTASQLGEIVSEMRLERSPIGYPLLQKRQGGSALADSGEANIVRALAVHIEAIAPNEALTFDAVLTVFSLCIAYGLLTGTEYDNSSRACIQMSTIMTLTNALILVLPT